VLRAVVLAAVLVVPVTAHAGRDLSRPGATFHGAAIDLDVKGADIHEVFRLLADVGNINIVVPDDVAGKVTLRLKRVPWDQVACTVAAVHKLSIVADRNVVLVRRRDAR
jgi:type II secretory pathway component HofQ